MCLGFVGLTPIVASGAPPTPTEEIVVYGDPYARWDNTRWWVNSEVTFPPGLLLSDEHGGTWSASHWRLSIVIHCQKGELQLWEGMEIACLIEDASLIAEDEIGNPRTRALVARLLDRIDAKLTGAQLQLQVSAKGTIPNLDLEGIASRNLVERRAKESIRQLLAPAVAGFSLPLPESQAFQWLEHHSALMDLPDATASRGSSEIVHERSHDGDGWRVVSGGEGSTALPMTGSLGGEVLFSMIARSMAHLRGSDGVMTERRWSVEGTPSPSSPVREPCAISGALRLLAPDELY